MTLALALILTFAVVLLVVVLACRRKANNAEIVDVFTEAFEASAPVATETSNTEAEEPPKDLAPDSTKVAADDEPKDLCQTNTVKSDADTALPVVENIPLSVSTVEPIANPWENCKTVECSPKPIEELECKSVTVEVTVKKEPKPRKTPLERTEAAILKLEGQIRRRTDLLKKFKKPVTKDERLNKWKASLKELKTARKALIKAVKKETDKKALFDRFGVPYPDKSSTK